MDGSKFRNEGLIAPVHVITLLMHVTCLSFPCHFHSPFVLMGLAPCPTGIYLNRPTSIGLEDENCAAVSYTLHLNHG